MYRKKMNAIVLTAVLTMSMLAGCGKEEKPKDTEQISSEEDTQTSDIDTTEAGNETETDTGNEPAEYPPITSDEEVITHNTVVTVGNAAYELYTYMDEAAADYAAAVNATADSLAGKADVYNLVIPLSSGITFPDNLRDQLSSSDQHQAILDIEDKMNDNVKFVNIYNSLMEHRTEYEYYRTDHHWTTLGAYYAYEDFCKAKGIEPEALDSYETKDFEGFIGSFYNDTSAAVLKENPDTVTAYYPHNESIMHVTAADGMEYDWPVIYDVSNYAAGLKYSAFIASDNPYTEIENKELTDGSSCIVVKESFGNAFVPFLVDHYQTIYVIDYRYWTGSISALAEEKGVSDVIFANNLSMIRNKSLVGKLHRVL